MMETFNRESQLGISVSNLGKLDPVECEEVFGHGNCIRGTGIEEGQERGKW